MPYSLSEIIVLFFTYSIVGWLWETFYCSIKDGHYDYRGFLFGPYCPVYGFAVTTILICTYRVQDNLILLFIIGIIVATIFEYIASVFLEKVFHMTLWDYSNLWGNIQGRVAPVISLFWGISVVLLVKFIQPLIQKVINWEEMKTHGALAVIIVLVMGTDLVLTIISVRKFHMSTKLWDEKINHVLSEVHVKAKDRRSYLLQHLDEIRPEHLSWNHRRFINSFDKMKFNDEERFANLKKELVKKGLLK